jgi:hypothetical protein
MKMTFCRQRLHKGKDTEQMPQWNVSKIIIALATFFHSFFFFCLVCLNGSYGPALEKLKIILNPDKEILPSVCNFIKRSLEAPI